MKTKVKDQNSYNLIAEINDRYSEIAVTYLLLLEQEESVLFDMPIYDGRYINEFDDVGVALDKNAAELLGKSNCFRRLYYHDGLDFVEDVEQISDIIKELDKILGYNNG